MKRSARTYWRTLSQRHRPKAFVLVGVLVVIMLLSMIALSLVFRMRAEETASSAVTGGEQAWAVAMSGVQAAIQLAARRNDSSIDVQNAPDLLKDQLVYDDGSDRWYFTVYSRSPSEFGGARFGLEDEASKLNINVVPTEWLRSIPGVEHTLEDALADFLDADSEPNAEGAEQEYYDALPVPYKIANGPLRSVEELLLVRGFTPAVLFGEDANQNYRLDANERDGDTQFPPDNGDDVLDAGLRPFVTVSSFDLNLSSLGVSRVNLNDPEAVLETNGLSAAAITHISTLRSNKMELAHVSDLFPDEEKDPAIFTAADMSLVLDQFTTTDDAVLPGLINVNTASMTVLKTIPGMDETIADSIVGARVNLPAEHRTNIVWLLTEGTVDLQQFKSVAPYLTTRSQQFGFKVLGFGLPSGRFRVLEAIVDASGSTPKVTYLRDITRLGLPFPVGTAAEATSPGLTRTKGPAPAPGAMARALAGHINASGKTHTFEFGHTRRSQSTGASISSARGGRAPHASALNPKSGKHG